MDAAPRAYTSFRTEYGLYFTNYRGYRIMLAYVASVDPIDLAAFGQYYIELPGVEVAVTSYSTAKSIINNYIRTGVIPSPTEQEHKRELVA